MEKQYLQVLPTPKKVTEGEGRVPFPKTVCLDAAFAGLLPVFADYAAKMLDVSVTEGCGGLSVLSDPALAAEGYRLDTAAMTLYACDYAGAAHGLATLLWLGKDGDLPAVTIEDAPDVPFRSLMVDLARQWHTLEQVLGYIDLCFLYKCSCIQLHFIDDQSYTLPSRLFPKASTPGRSYSFEQIETLNAYAAARGVEIVPEFETPGHSKALIEAYPEQFGNAIVGEVKAMEGVLVNTVDNIVCAGKPGVFESIAAMLGEIAGMFPHSRYIHIGGDEAALSNWAACADCQAFMEAKGIPDVKALYTYFVKRATDAVLALGRTPIVWEGFPKAGTEAISREVVVIAWESYYQLAPDLLEAGFDIINCSWQPLYITPGLRWTAKDILAWNIYNWQHWYPNSPAHLNPIHVQPTSAVMGGQLCDWECTYAQAVDCVIDNLAALSERTWRVKRVLEDEEFEEVLSPMRSLIWKLLPKK